MSFIGGVAAGITGGLIGNAGASSTNRANERIASARNAFESAEAVKARSFSREERLMNQEYQRDMSNTAIRRRMKDMIAGGINPILAGKYEASSPAGNIGATAKANAHGYTAINELQPLLDNLGTAIQFKKLFHESQKAEQDAKIAGNVAQIGTPMSEIAKDADHGWRKVKEGAQWVGQSAAKIKLSIDDNINKAQHALQKAQRKTGMGVRLGDGKMHWFPDALKK